MAATCSFSRSALCSSCQLAPSLVQLERAQESSFRKSCTRRPGSTVAWLRSTSAVQTKHEKCFQPRKVTQFLSSKRRIQVRVSEGNTPSAAEGSRLQSDEQGLDAAIRTRTSPQAAPPSIHRRQALLALCLLSASLSQSNSAQAAELSVPAKEESPLDSLASFLDPDEIAASGRKIPKAYKKQVREVVRTLKESLSDQQAKDFRRKADPAKEAIRGYIVNWRGAASVQAEVSYTALERVLRALGAFYSKAGPNARVTDELREQIFKDLDLAENSL